MPKTSTGMLKQQNVDISYSGYFDTPQMPFSNSEILSSLELWGWAKNSFSLL